MTETSTSPTKRQKIWAFTKTTLRRSARPLYYGVIGLLIGGLVTSLVLTNRTDAAQDTAKASPSMLAPSPETRDENVWPPVEKGFTIHLGTSGRSVRDIARDEIKRRYHEVVAEERFEDWVREELESLERQRCAEIDWTRNGVPYCAVEPRKVGIRPKGDKPVAPPRTSLQDEVERQEGHR